MKCCNTVAVLNKGNIQDSDGKNKWEKKHFILTAFCLLMWTAVGVILYVVQILTLSELLEFELYKKNPGLYEKP